MNALWIVVGLGLIGAIARTIGRSRRRRRRPDLGFVSHQWVAEHRLSQGLDRQG